MENFIENYGLLAIFLLSLIERDGTFLFAGVIVASGIHSFSSVILIGFSAAYLADIICFAIGWKSNFLLKRFKKLNYVEEKLKKLHERYGFLSILITQFLYGIRSPGMLIWGTLKIKPLNFFLFDVVGCLILVLFLVSIGYLGGETVHTLFSK